MEICTVEGCDRTRKAKGLCDMHHQRQRRTGSLGVAQPLRTSVKTDIPKSKTFHMKKCNAAGCVEISLRMGLCERHLREFNLE